MGSCDEADTAPEQGALSGSDIAYAWFLCGRRDLFFGKRKAPETVSEQKSGCIWVQTALMDDGQIFTDMVS